MADRPLDLKRLATHPFFHEHRLVFETAPMTRLYEEIQFSFLIGAGGRWSESPSGGGKTTLAQYLVERLRAEYPDTATYFISTHVMAPAAYKGFIYQWDVAAGNSTPSRDTNILRGDVERRLIEQASNSSLKKVFLIVDEAQAMRDPEFFFLKDIHNALAAPHLALVTYLVGEAPVLGRKIEQFSCDDRKQGFTARFARKQATFAMYETVEDVHSVCEGLDSIVWAECQGRSVTQDLLPLAYASGYRLAMDASSIHNALGAGPGQARRIFDTVKYLLVWMSKCDRPGLKLHPDVLRKAVLHAQGR